MSKVLMSDAICGSVFDSLKRAIVHASTFSENGLAMRASLATLDVLEGESLGPRAAAAGEALRARLASALAPYPMLKDVRGVGLLSGIEFAAPKPARTSQGGSRERSETQVCADNFTVLKAPPLVVAVVAAVRAVVELMRSSPGFWPEALGIARRAVAL